MSIPLKAYFKENDGYMLEDPGCFMKLWHGKQKHVLYALAMKFAPALSIIFGPESLALCGSRFLEKDDLESHRENLVFLRK